ncbi:MAG: ABC transporter substrate-binding protein, partial [Desulfomonilaceae bacterium]
MTLAKYGLALVASATIFFTYSIKSLCDSGQKICVQDSIGAMVCLEAPASRVVSLAPSLTELMFALGAGNKLVGRTTKCDFPPCVKRIMDVGAYTNPDFERLITAQPDLVLAPKAGINREFIERLRCFKIPVYVDDSSNTEDIEHLIHDVGTMVGVDKEADRVIADIKIHLGKIRKTIAGIKRPSVLLVIGLRPLVVAGPKSFLGSLVKEAGGSNIVEGTKVEYPKFDIEEVIRRDPEVIFMLDKECRADNCIKEWDNHPTLKAVKNKRVYVLDADIVSRPGPRFIEALETLVKLLHPQIFTQSSSSLSVSVRI